MGQSVSHYLIDWDHFVSRWREEENALEALAGAERCRCRDDYLTTVVSFGDLYDRYRGGGRAADDPLDEVVSAFCEHYRNPVHDLGDDFAYEEGGFTVVMEPARVKRLVAAWKAAAPAELETRLLGGMNAEDARRFVAFLAERMAFLERAAASGRGYAARVG